MVQINKELKAMMIIATAEFIVVIMIINSINLFTGVFITEATRRSQIIATNRLKKPHWNRPSEFQRYPNLNKPITLVATRKTNRLYIIHQQQVIYIANATIKCHPSMTTASQLRGEQAIHIIHHKKVPATTWTNFHQRIYLETPTKKSWWKPKQQPVNTIWLSKPDALWLQHLPRGAKLIIK